MICPKCGAQLSDDAWFCEACGKVQIRSAKESKPAESLAKSGKSQVKPPASRRRLLVAYHVRKPYAPDVASAGSRVPFVVGALVACALVVGIFAASNGALAFSLPKFSLPAPAAGNTSQSQGTSGDDGASNPGKPGDTSGGTQAGGSMPSGQTPSSQGGESGDGSKDGSSKKAYSYHLVRGVYTWDQAKDYCEKHGGTLACPTSDKEWSAVLSACASDKDACVIWVGGQRSGDGFVWLDGTSVKNVPWAKGEPNNRTGDENYLAVMVTADGYGVYDVPSDIRSYYPDSYLALVMQTSAS